jgi:hypothetical protein
MALTVLVVVAVPLCVSVRSGRGAAPPFDTARPTLRAP